MEESDLEEPADAERTTAPGSAAPDRSWAHLDRLRVGRYGEYFAKMALVRAGLDVYSPEVDDRAIDLVIRIPSSPPRYLDVQVKTMRGATGYVFMRKPHFTIEDNRYLALVLLAEGAEPEMYLIPSTKWREPLPPFSSRDYPGLKSEPEYRLALSPSALEWLRAYRFTGQIDLAAPDGATPA